MPDSMNDSPEKIQAALSHFLGQATTEEQRSLILSAAEKSYAELCATSVVTLKMECDRGEYYCPSKGCIPIGEDCPPIPNGEHK